MDRSTIPPLQVARQRSTTVREEPGILDIGLDTAKKWRIPLITDGPRREGGFDTGTIYS